MLLLFLILQPLPYRLNPDDAFVAATATGKFITRDVKVSSRAAGDIAGVLNCTGLVKAEDEGVLTASATLNFEAYEDIENNAIVALQVANGQKVVTSDYLMVNQAEVNATLVNAIATDKAIKDKAQAPVKTGIYPITRPQGSNEKISAYIDAALNGSSVAAASLAYNGTLDVATIPALWGTEAEDYLKNLGFEGISYKFSLPSEYIVGNTDQQWFVSLDGTILSVNGNNVTGNKTQAIGRTPIVKVDAYVGENLLATAFMFITIGQPGSTQPTLDAINLGTVDLNYRQIATKGVQGAKADQVTGKLDWQGINNKIYGATNLTAATFNSQYNSTAKVVVSVPRLNAKGQVEPYKVTFTKSGDVYTSTELPGIFVKALLDNNTATETNSEIVVSVNNKIHTQEWMVNNGTKDVPYFANEDAANYTVTITFEAKNEARADVVLTNVINVTEPHTDLAMNVNYYDAATNTVKTHGAKFNNAWKVSLDLGEAFAKVNNQSVFDALSMTNTLNNVAGVAIKKFTSEQIEVNKTKIDLITKAGNILNVIQPMDVKTATGVVEYQLSLANGEQCQTVNKFNVEFTNPFVGTTGAGYSINGNEVGAQAVNVAPQLAVNDFNGKTILSWVKHTDKDGNVTSQGLELSATAGSNGYNLNGYDATYSFVNDDAYKTFMSGLTSGSLSITNGTVNYTPGATLLPSYTLTIKVTVTFSDANGKISTVDSFIPFTIKGSN